jgi:translation initiation factor IF-1
MRKNWILPATLLCAAGLAADDGWSKSFIVKGDPDVVLKSNDAHIKVKGWNRKEVAARLIVEGYAQDDYQVHPRQAGDRIEIEVRKRQRWDWNWSVRRRFELEVSMPHHGALDADTGDGHVSVAAVSGKIRVHTGDGHISASDLEGDLDLRTRDGHISLGRVRGSLAARTGDGHISVEGRFEALDLETGDGHISAAVDDRSAMSRDWRLVTGDGRINLELPGGFRADLEAHTGDGRIRADLTGSDSQTRRGSGRNYFRSRLSGGGRNLTLRSNDGQIIIKQRRTV